MKTVSSLVTAFALVASTSLGANESWTPVRTFRLFPRSLWPGLPQSTVRLIAQDSKGILWIGTFDGLASFDGHELTPVTPAPNAPSQGVLTAMTARSRGGLAVASPAGVHISVGEIWRLVPATGSVVALTEARDGTLWMADGSGSVFTLGENDEWQAHPEVQGSALALADAPDGSVWAATARGALRLEKGTVTEIEVRGLEGAPSAILVARDGRVWMTTYAGKLYWTRPGETTWHEPSLDNWPESDQLRGLAEDRRGRIWAGTINGVVAFGTPETGFTTWGWENAPLGGIQTILADREGSLWFGMNRAGLAQWVGEAWSHRVSFADGGEPGDRVAIAGVTGGKDDRSVIVAGYALGVLKLAEGQPPRIWANAEGLIEHARQAVEPERGTLWVAARFGVMEASGNEKLRYTLKLDSGFANGLFESPTGRWYAATSTEGVFVRTGSEWRPAPSINENLDSLHVRAIAWTSGGDMWVETLRGVSVFRHDEGFELELVAKITHANEPAFPESVNAVVEADNGDMWVGGIGGIAVGSGSGWRSVPMPNGPGPTIYSMAKAADGAIWAGGANGVGRYADGHWTTWDSRSGLLDDECNSNGMFIDDDGTVYVGTMGGLARFDPKVEPLAPPPLELRWTSAPPVDEAGKATPAARDLQLRWSAAWLGPEPVEYRVRMPRLKDSWSEPAENGSLDVQNLGPGLHSVEVEARVAGVLPWTPMRMDVFVEPMWHETLPARSAMVGLLALFGFGLVRLRGRQLRRHAAALEATVRARTTELAEKVAELEESERRGQAARDALEQMALVDGLTGIANRRRFDDALETEWRRSARGGRPLALVLFDVDHFKRFNDTWGHIRGDECLRSVAAVLSKECGRAADVVARFGGEEFVLILPDTTVAGALDVVRSLLRRFEQLRIPGAASEPCAEVSLSGGGVTLVPTVEGDPTEVLHLADHLLYQAKAAGRNRVLYRDLTEQDRPAEPMVIQLERRRGTGATKSSA